MDCGQPRERIAPQEHGDAKGDDSPIDHRQQPGQDAAERLPKGEQHEPQNDHHRQHAGQDRGAEQHAAVAETTVLHACPREEGDQAGIKGQHADVAEDGGIAEQEGAKVGVHDGAAGSR